MVKRIAVALILAASAFSHVPVSFAQRFEGFGAGFLIGKWDAFDSAGRKVGTFEFGPMKDGDATMIITASRGGRRAPVR